MVTMVVTPPPKKILMIAAQALFLALQGFFCLTFGPLVHIFQLILGLKLFLKEVYFPITHIILPKINIIQDS